jgi:hypothetical protein
MTPKFGIQRGSLFSGVGVLPEIFADWGGAGRQWPLAARRMISTNSAGFSDALPTKKPSTSGLTIR